MQHCSIISPLYITIQVQRKFRLQLYFICKRFGEIIACESLGFGEITYFTFSG